MFMIVKKASLYMYVVPTSEVAALFLFSDSF